MRVLVDRKKKNVRIKVDRFEELEELKDYIEKGSVVSGYTLRNRFIVRDAKKVKCGKERVRVSIVVENSFFELTNPDKPKSPRQKYRLTSKFVRRRIKS